MNCLTTLSISLIILFALDCEAKRPMLYPIAYSWHRVLVLHLVINP